MALKRPARRKGRIYGAVLAAVLLLGCLLLWRASSSASAVSVAHEHSRVSVSSGAASRLPAPVAKPRPLTDAIRARCAGTLGSWCTGYYTQPELPAVTAPRGNKTCSLDCNKVGTCSALSGLCTCPVGWRGFNCLHPMKRYCANRHTYAGFDRVREPPNVTLGIDKPSIFAFPESHCAGTCDEDIAACYCPSHLPYGRVPAAEDAPQGSPPQRQGRPMGMWCQPNKDEAGRESAWGTVDPEHLYGPEGWCVADEPKYKCACYIDGWSGSNCGEPHEQFCFNQCNGHGDCISGYCRCHKGWHGLDCAHRSQTADVQQPGLEKERPWIANHVHTPAAQDFAPNATRTRPLIYVYEMPTDYATLMVAYRYGGEACVPRFYGASNDTRLSAWTYGLEGGLLELMLQSEHRTLNPDEADFFYVPVFTSCFIHPVRDSGDSLRDFFYSVQLNRVQGATNMLLEAYHYISSHFPYWDRRGGRDHIWLVTHDEGPCWVPAAIRPSIILSHWGRKDANHTSGTGYGADYYSFDFQHAQFEPEGYLKKLGSFPCYDPVKDLIVPLWKTPDHYHRSPLVGGATRERTWLAFHRGRVQHENPPYSRGIRQRLANASALHNWRDKHKIVVGEYDAVEGDYSELLSSSSFCLVLPGDGWSARMDDATVHGCIPVIIMDEVDVSFESIIDLTAFSIRIPQKDAEKLPEILMAVPEQRRQEMRRNMAKVWQRFTYSSYRPFAKRFKELQQDNAAGGGGAGEPKSLPATVPDLDPTADDAFRTIIAWLHSRIPDTRDAL